MHFSRRRFLAGGARAVLAIGPPAWAFDAGGRAKCLTRQLPTGEINSSPVANWNTVDLPPLLPKRCAVRFPGG